MRSPRPDRAGLRCCVRAVNRRPRQCRRRPSRPHRSDREHSCRAAQPDEASDRDRNPRPGDRRRTLSAHDSPADHRRLNRREKNERSHRRTETKIGKRERRCVGEQCGRRDEAGRFRHRARPLRGRRSRSPASQHGEHERAAEETDAGERRRVDMTFGERETTEERIAGEARQRNRRKKDRLRIRTCVHRRAAIRESRALGREWRSRPAAAPSMSARPHAVQTSSETRMLEPSSLLSASMREATFTTSPMTVYSLRCAEPMLPTTASPAWRPMPTRVGGILPSATSCSTRATMSSAASTAARARVVLGDRRAEDGHEAVAEELVHDAVSAHDGVDRRFEDDVQVVDDLAGCALRSRTR